MRHVSILVAFCLLASMPLFAGDGATPIWEPTTITQPGSYVLIRDIGELTDSVVIGIEADHVDLDLNGFTVISGWGPAIEVNDVSDITVRDGEINSQEVSIGLRNVSRFMIRRLMINSGDDCAIAISDSTDGIVENSVVHGELIGMCVSGERIDIQHNRAFGSIEIGDASHCRIAHNVSNHFITSHLASGILLFGNVGRGMYITGDYNHIESNLLTGNTSNYGLQITGNDNVLRGNTVRGNSGTGCSGTSSGGDFCDAGTNNTSHGDNYMPDKM